MHGAGNHSGCIDYHQRRFDSVSLSLTGVLWGLASSVAGAASNIQPNAVLKKIPVTVVVGGGMTVGGIVMSIFFPPWAIEANWTTQSALFYTYIVVVGTLFFFTCSMFQVSR